MISKKRFLLKRAIDDSFGKVLTKILSRRKKKELPEKIDKIVVLKLSSLGDSLLSLPGIKNLKEATGAKIIVVHSKDNESVFRNHDFIDENVLLDVSGYNPFKLFKSLMKLRKKKADVSFDLSHTGNLSSVFSSVSGKYLSRFYNEDFPSRKGFYDREVPLDKEIHMVKNYNKLLDIKKNKKDNLKLINPVNIENKVEILEGKKNLIGIHPCHEIKEKSWEKENFAKIIDYLIENGKTPVILGSPKEKQDVERLLSLVKNENREKIIDLSGKLDIHEVFSAMKYFDFFVSNDGGIMHIAASFGIPTLGIFTAETPKKYAPFNDKSFAIDARGLSKEESYNTAKKVIDIFMNKYL